MLRVWFATGAAKPVPCSAPIGVASNGATVIVSVHVPVSGAASSFVAVSVAA